jgi:ubiquinone/menaquinone biosynthesis C-methylase UbiE
MYIRIEMEQDKIWDYFQNDGADSFDGSYNRLNFLTRFCKEKGIKVLNIGIGNGTLEQIAINKNIDIYTLDPSEKAILKIRDKIEERKAKVGYSQEIPFENNFFDIVIMSEVLEHLNNDVLTATIKDVDRVLKKNGKFIGTVPYAENLIEQVVVCPKCAEKFHRWGHIQSFNEENLNLLLKQKFSKTYLKPKLFINWKTLNVKGRIVAVLNFIAYTFGIKKSGLNLFFEARK